MIEKKKFIPFMMWLKKILDFLDTTDDELEQILTFYDKNNNKKLGFTGFFQYYLNLLILLKKE